MQTRPAFSIAYGLLTGAITMLILGGCATSSTPLRTDAMTRQAVDTPDRFLVGSHDGTGLTEPVPGAGCRNPMVDPRDATHLRLVRSQAGLGDYEVPERRYGTGQRELLRLECSTGRATGIVRR